MDLWVAMYDFDKKPQSVKLYTDVKRAVSEMRAYFISIGITEGRAEADDSIRIYKGKKMIGCIMRIRVNELL